MKIVQKTMVLFLSAALCALVFSCAGASAPAAEVDFTTGILATGEWMTYSDIEGDGGSSTAEMVIAEEEIDGASVTTYSVTGNVTTQFRYGFAGWGLDADEETLERYKTARALSFKIIGDGSRYTIKFKLRTVTDHCYHEFTFPTTAGEVMKVEVPMRFFMQPSWGDAVRFNQAQVIGVEWQTHESSRTAANNPFSVKMWDFLIHP